jgi:hypothetical protein
MRLFGGNKIGTLFSDFPSYLSWQCNCLSIYKLTISDQAQVTLQLTFQSFRLGAKMFSPFALSGQPNFFTAARTHPLRSWSRL